jgi:hypothetical protein
LLGPVGVGGVDGLQHRVPLAFWNRSLTAQPRSGTPQRILPPQVCGLSVQRIPQIAL